MYLKRMGNNNDLLAITHLSYGGVLIIGSIKGKPCTRIGAYYIKLIYDY